MEAYDLSADRSMVTTGTLESCARRCLDLLGALSLLLLLAPVMLGVAVAVRLDSRGPALFRQRRVGHRERQFTVYKFRSMRLDADEERHRQYVSALIGNGSGRGGAEGDGGENLYKLAVDDRITPVGRRIRSWSVDELPQLFNVVLGDMSLVGPRPAIPYEVESYPAWYAKRFAVKPGLTGLWQVSGRNQRTYEEMVTLDIDYAENRSLLGDLAILARTPGAVLGRKGVA